MLIEAAANAKSDRAIQIADRIWWVGHYLQDDVFQCHVYLIENGDQSVLIDPGSKLTFDHTLAKIEQVTAFSNIRYFICHHQDPDITGALPLIDEIVSRQDAVVVTHWRAEVLLKHYGLKMPFWRVEENDWTLELGDGRELTFVFTPYAHFPGAFCTLDSATGVLFSSDIFGGFTDGFQLVARDENYFEGIRPFHEHYMPSNDVLQHVMGKFAQLPIRLIAPQHGSIIPERLVHFMIDKLMNLDCGLYLLADRSTDLRRLIELNKIIRDITETMILYRDFQDIAMALLEIAKRLIPAKSLEFYAPTEEPGKFLHLAPSSRYRGAVVEAPEGIAEIFNNNTQDPVVCRENRNNGFDHAMAIPLFAVSSEEVEAVAIVELGEHTPLTHEIETMIRQMQDPLHVAVEREVIYRTLDMERRHLYERSIRDPLTGLFTRNYMHDSVDRLFSIHDRDESTPVAMALLDIDHFKSVNDTWGHNQGDEVLRRVADVIKEVVRTGDIPVRLGGEEFAVFIIGQSSENIADLGERLRSRVEELTFPPPMEERTITISVGVALRGRMEGLDPFIERTDKALYRAKNDGRNQVVPAEEPQAN